MTRAPLDPALSISFTTGSSSASVADGSLNEPGAAGGAIKSPHFVTASGEPFLIKTIAPMSTATAATGTRASALRANWGFDVYEWVAPFGRATVRKHHFSTNKWVAEGEDEREAKGNRRTTCFLFPLFQ